MKSEQKNWRPKQNASMQCYKKILFFGFLWFFLCSFERQSIQRILYYSHSPFFIGHVTQCIAVAERNNYLSFLKKTFYYSGLPVELAFLPVIESCYDVNAVSSKGAVGMWQINPITARHLDLGMQDRYDWKKSTNAIVEYFHFLRIRFPSWPLILAAYNIGPTYIRSEMDYHSTEAFEQIRLPRETRVYVYQYYAMLKIINRKRISVF